MTYRQIAREADLISKGAVYNGLWFMKAKPLSATHDPLVKKFNRLLKPIQHQEAA